MGDQIAEVAGAGAPVEIQGYKFSPITARGWGRITQWVRSYVLQSSMDRLQMVRDHGLRQQMLDRAMVFTARLSLFVQPDDDLEAYTAFHTALTSPDGLLMILKESALAAQRHAGAYPKKTIDDEWAEQVFDSLDCPAEAVRRVQRISGMQVRRWMRGRATVDAEEENKAQEEQLPKEEPQSVS